MFARFFSGIECVDSIAQSLSQLRRTEYDKGHFLLAVHILLFLAFPNATWASEKTLDEKINEAIAPLTELIFSVIFFAPFSIAGKPIPFILVWLAGTALFLTVYFRLLNLRSFGIALKTVRGKYSKPNDPGEITHFQALTAALSATVGLGNIAGVAIAISKGGPGAAFWMIVIGLLGMTTKFAECTLGVRYRDIDKDGKVHGGPMKYLTKGLAERGLAPLGKFLGIVFAVLCIGASLGGGNMFQVNQACSQFIQISGGSGSILADYRWVFGVVVAVLVGVVIIGGIRRIAHVTSRLVPLMCITYLLGAFAVLVIHAGEILCRWAHPQPSVHTGCLRRRLNRRPTRRDSARHLLERSWDRIRADRPLRSQDQQTSK